MKCIFIIAAFISLSISQVPCSLPGCNAPNCCMPGNPFEVPSCVGAGSYYCGWPGGGGESVCNNGEWISTGQQCPLLQSDMKCKFSNGKPLTLPCVLDKSHMHKVPEN